MTPTGTYTKQPAQFIEGDVFRTVVPVYQPETVKPTLEGNIPGNGEDFPVNFPVNPVARRRVQAILKGIYEGKTRTAADWADQLGVTDRTVKNDLRILREAGFIRFEDPDKTGHYVLTESGKRLFSNQL